MSPNRSRRKELTKNVSKENKGKLLEISFGGFLILKKKKDKIRIIFNGILEIIENVIH